MYVYSRDDYTKAKAKAHLHRYHLLTATAAIANATEKREIVFIQPSTVFIQNHASRLH